MSTNKTATIFITVARITKSHLLVILATLMKMVVVFIDSAKSHFGMDMFFHPAC